MVGFVYFKVVSLWSSTKDYRLALQLFLSIPASLCILFSCFLTGNVIVRLLRYKCNWFAEGLLIRVGLGFGVIGNQIMVLNFLHIASPPIILLSLAL